MTRNEQIVELRRAGRTLAAIGAQFGVTRECIRKILERKYGDMLCSRCRLPNEQLDGDGLCAKCARLLEIVCDDSLTVAEAAVRAGEPSFTIRYLRRKFEISSPKPICSRPKYFRDGVPADVLDPQASEKALAEKYGLGRGAVYYARKTAGVTGQQRPNWKPGKPWTPEEDRVLVEMRRAGSSWREIGERLGKSVQACRVRPLNQRRFKGIEMGAWIE